MSDTEVESDPATEEEEEEELDDDSTSSSESDAEVAVKPARDPRRRPIVPESDDDGVVAKLPTNTISFSLPTVSLALSEALAGGDKARAEDVRPPRLLSAALHPHQLIALKWLAGLWHASVGGILGDQMGLGKTIEAISMIAHVMESCNSVGPFLVVCPVSVLPNWKSEFLRFAPAVRVLSYCGGRVEREGLQATITASIMKQPKEARKDPAFDFHVLLTTYEHMLSDVGFLGRFRWRLAVIDEAHRLKNYHSKLFTVLTTRFFIARCLLMTGTPVQNNLAELYSLLSLCLPKVFPLGMADDFVSSFSPQGKSKPGAVSHSMAELQTLLKPVFLRRTIAEAGIALPPITENLLQCPMTPLQKEWYMTVLKGHVSQLVSARSTASASLSGLQNVVMQLRKVCNHPYLFPGAEPEPFAEGDHIFQNCGKMWVLDRLLLRLRAEGHRVLVFSQFTGVLDILQDYLAYRGWPYERLDGSVRSEERWTSVQRFQRSDSVLSADTESRDKSGGPFVFLLSTRAGGVGLNLTQADCVIMYDSDWNPQADLQAIGRAHRLGQTHPVRVFRLMTSSTVEEVMMKRALTKLQLTRDVVAGGAFTGSAPSASGSAADGDDDDPAPEPSSMLQMIQFGLSSLTADAASSQQLDVLLVNSIVDKAMLPPEKAAALTNVPDALSASATVMDIGAVASQLQTSVYEYEGKEYNPKEATTEDSNALQALLSSAAPALRRASAPSKPPVSKTAKPARKKGVQSKPKARPRHDSSEEDSDGGSVGSLDDFIVDDSDTSDSKPASSKKAKPASRAPVDPSYVSLALPFPEVVFSVVSDVVDDGLPVLPPEYVIGDATKPSRFLQRVLPDGSPGSLDDTAIILHCVDASGKWGSGGLFSAFDALDRRVGRSYERAARNHDLTLGDTHLVLLDQGPEDRPYRVFVALLVVLARDKKGSLLLDDTAFKSSLQRVSIWGTSNSSVSQLSVHTPRIGARMPGISWYTVERLLVRCLCQRGIRVIVYYYQRQDAGTLARPASSPSPSHSVVPSPPPHPEAPASSPPPLEPLVQQWLVKGASLPHVVACDGWEENIRFIFSQSAVEIAAALANLTAELDTGSVDPSQVALLSFFQAAMRAAVAATE